jgi:hypothetical protein
MAKLTDERQGTSSAEWQESHQTYRTGQIQRAMHECATQSFAAALDGAQSDALQSGC